MIAAVEIARILLERQIEKMRAVAALTDSEAHDAATAETSNHKSRQLVDHTLRNRAAQTER